MDRDDSPLAGSEHAGQGALDPARDDVGPVTPPAAPPTEPVQFERPAPETKWPNILGIIAMIFGVLSIIGGIWGFVANRLLSGMFSAEELAVLESWKTASAISSSLILVAGGLLIFGAVGVLRRRQFGVRWIQIWAIVKMLVVVYTTLIGMDMQAEMFQAQQQASNLPPGTSGSLLAMMQTVGVVLGVAWGWALPVFVLIWFRRATIQAEVRQWD